MLFAVLICVCVIAGLYYLLEEKRRSLEEKTALNLTGKRILITGAATGLGEATAYEYAKSGSKLIITDMNGENLITIKDRCLKLGALQVEGFTADLSKGSDRMALIKFVKLFFNDLNQLILVHVAPSRYAPWKSTDQDLKYLTLSFEVNFLSYVKLSSEVSKALMEEGGCIGVVSSLAGKLPLKYLAPYCATKHALQGFFSTWRNELKNEKSKLSITICTFGLITSPSALSDIENGFVSMPPKSGVSPENAARQILRGVSLRENHFIYPLHINFVLQVYKIIPRIMECIIGSYISAGPRK